MLTAASQRIFPGQTSGLGRKTDAKPYTIPRIRIQHFCLVMLFCLVDQAFELEILCLPDQNENFLYTALLLDHQYLVWATWGCKSIHVYQYRSATTGAILRRYLRQKARNRKEFDFAWARPSWKKTPKTENAEICKTDLWSLTFYVYVCVKT